MKILLDECVPTNFCESFLSHECDAARPAGFGGKKNGELLRFAEEAGYEVILTVYKSIPYQQKLHGRRIALLIIEIHPNRLRQLTVACARLPGCFTERSARVSETAPGKTVG